MKHTVCVTAITPPEIEMSYVLIAPLIGDAPAKAPKGSRDFDERSMAAAALCSTY